MVTSIASREAAIEHFQKLGVNAELYSGPIGGGIKVWSRSERTAPEITVLHDLTYITLAGQRWQVFDASSPSPVMQESLGDAVNAVALRIQGKQG